MEKREKRILFINGSPNKDGNTAKLAKELLGIENYETLNLVDYKIFSYGQEFAQDQFNEIIDEMTKSQIIVIGSPLYWHNICGSVRNLLDRFYGSVNEKEFSGRKLIFIFQGASPEKWMLDVGEFTMKRFSTLYGFEYLGMATVKSEAKKLANKYKNWIT